MHVSCLIVGDPADISVRLVVSHLSKMGDVSVRYLNSSECVSDKISISLPFSPQTNDPRWNFNSAWLRRLPPTVLPADLKAAEIDYANGSWNELLNGIMSLRPSSWLNSPAAHKFANNKIMQLSAASQTGFVVPRTIVSNSSQLVQQFAVDVGQIVCKTLITKVGWPALATIRLDKAHFAVLDDLLAASPAIFQEYIVAKKRRPPNRGWK